MTFLAAKTLDLGDRQAGHPAFSQSFPYLFEFEGLDDGGNLFHVGVPLVCRQS